MSFFGICALCVLCLPLDLDYLTYYKNKNPKDIPKPMPSANLSEVIDEWDVKFINSIELDNVFDLINATNYMDIPSLNKINSEIDYNNGWSFYIVVKNK